MCCLLPPCCHCGVAGYNKQGSQAINYATAGSNLTSLYVFKFSVTLSNSNGVTKNGIHWVSVVVGG